MLGTNIGIDLGTTSILIFVEGKGIVVSEPSAVAFDTDTGRLLAVGQKAADMIGRNPDSITVVKPMRSGVISDFTATKAIVRVLLYKVCKNMVFKPNIVVCMPSTVTNLEKRTILDLVTAAGAGRACLIEEPLAAALGAGLDIRRPMGTMVVDIGGGTTDIAVLSLGGKVKATSVRVAGNHYDEEILKHVRNKYSIAIGQRTAEELKKHVACCPQKTDFHESMEIKGRSLLTGLPVRVTVSTDDLYEPVMMLSEQIGTAAHQVLEKTPPELAGDIYRNGVMLTGGGAQLHGLTEYLSQELKVEVTVSPDPVNCVALGTAQSLSIGDKLETGFTDATPRIGRR